MIFTGQALTSLPVGLPYEKGKNIGRGPGFSPPNVVLQGIWCEEDTGKLLFHSLRDTKATASSHKLQS